MDEQFSQPFIHLKKKPQKNGKEMKQKWGIHYSCEVMSSGLLVCICATIEILWPIRSSQRQNLLATLSLSFYSLAVCVFKFYSCVIFMRSPVQPTNQPACQTHSNTICTEYYVQPSPLFFFTCSCRQSYALHKFFQLKILRLFFQFNFTYLLGEHNRILIESNPIESNRSIDGATRFDLIRFNKIYNAI